MKLKNYSEPFKVIVKLGILEFSFELSLGILHLGTEENVLVPTKYSGKAQCHSVVKNWQVLVF